MKVWHYPVESIDDKVSRVVAIGTFDGIHLGHRVVLDTAKAIAQQRSLILSVITFEPHPLVVLRPEKAPKKVVDDQQKLDLLEQNGVDEVVIVRFDQHRADQSATDFVKEVLVDQLTAAAVVVGQDFHFGSQRQGDVELLTKQGNEYNFEVFPVPLVKIDDQSRVSSSKIRSLLAEGNVEDVAKLLGRNHQIRGVVEHGDGRGRQLGFPTANLKVDGDVVTADDGVYAGYYIDDKNQSHPSAISIGSRPTFYEQDKAHSIVEAHLLDFEGDLYDQPAKVELVARLRGQLRFSSIEDLIVQMTSDVEATRACLG